MKKKLNCILLVDDDDDCNYFHRRLFEEIQCAEKIEIVTDGQEALDFLAGSNSHPELIFLDMNMPVMDGWEFLEEYDKLDNAKEGKTILILLTTSLNPKDQKLSSKHKNISGFQNKLLKRDDMTELLKAHFPSHL